MQMILFLVPLVIILFLADGYISRCLKKSNNHAEKEYPVWNALFEKQVNSDIVIYGSSRAWVHINSTMITDAFNVPTYNLGIDGHNFWMQYYRHRLLLEDKAPKIIIHSVDVFTLQKNKDLYNLDQFLPYMLWNEELKNYTESYNGFTFFDYYVPFVRYYGKHKALKTSLQMARNPEDKPGRILGYQGLDKKWNTDLDKAKGNMEKLDIVLDAETISLFEKYLLECKSKNIKVVFVYTPEYKDGQQFVNNREQIIGIYREFAKKYDITFYDYSDDELSYNKKYFYNASHLNKTGAELFTKKLIDTLKTLPEFRRFSE